MIRLPPCFFFFNDTATTEIYTLSLHDALPICFAGRCPVAVPACSAEEPPLREVAPGQDRKSTRLNSSHSQISYAVFCLKKKKKNRSQQHEKQKTNTMSRTPRTHRPAVDKNNAP